MAFFSDYSSKISRNLISGTRRDLRSLMQTIVWRWSNKFWSKIAWKIVWITKKQNELLACEKTMGEHEKKQQNIVKVKKKNEHCIVINSIKKISSRPMRLILTICSYCPNSSFSTPLLPYKNDKIDFSMCWSMKRKIRIQFSWTWCVCWREKREISHLSEMITKVSIADVAQWWIIF